jgi:hypothetical protein
LKVAQEVQVVEVPEQVKQLESQDKQEFPERNLLDEQLRQLVLDPLQVRQEELQRRQEPLDK